jgi:glutamyl-tRNA synthetase
MYVALINWALARQSGGAFLVRIEDTDRTRFVEGAEAMFLEALRWLGLDHDEGPDKGGPVGPYRQSERTGLYLREVERLLAAGRAYRCFCPPERLEALRQDQRRAGAETLGYDRRCRGLGAAEVASRLAAGEPSTVRLAVPLEGQTRFHDGVRGDIVIENRTIDDQVLLKSDGFPTYHLASVVDDHRMGVTHVIRAEEWITSTPKHVLLYEAFGWTPPAFYHLPLIRNPDRSKLSKRKNPTNVLWYRREGYLAEAVVNFLGMLGHSMPDGREVFTREEFRGAFSWDRVTTTGPIFDMEKFEWLNGTWIRRLAPEDLAARLRDGGFMPQALAARYPPEKVLAIVRLMQERLRRLNEFADGAAFFLERLPYEAADLVPMKKNKAVKTPGETAAALRDVRAAVAAAAEPFTAAATEGPVRALAERLGWKAPDLFMALRVAVTMRRVSTPLFETMAVLGREECLARLDEALARLAPGGPPVTE